MILKDLTLFVGKTNKKIKAKLGEVDGVEDDEDEGEFEAGDVTAEYARSGRLRVKNVMKKLQINLYVLVQQLIIMVIKEKHGIMLIVLQYQKV